MPLRAPESHKALNPRTGYHSIAAAFVISNEMRDPFRIPVRSLALLKMTIKYSKKYKFPSFGRSRFILCRGRSRPVRVRTAATKLILQPKQLQIPRLRQVLDPELVPGEG
ncbi:hypothetical protein A3841_09240 [Pontibacter flavimaris]|uniref:Uncharacterized protein n=1 Tax=Pontibacter flavimaris TaxID=1797110 RepID=A0A1Q5PIW0_9BACT|nr:hypothetical protein A3841_09240 [Pontibacter flavimaris]